MNIEEQIIDMLSGELTQLEQQSLMQELQSNPSAMKLYLHHKEINELSSNKTREVKQPTSKLKNNVLALIQEEKRTVVAKKNTRKILQLPLLQKIASVAAIVVFGLLIWQQFSVRSYRNEMRQELAFLRAQIDEHIESPSVSTRIKAVNFSKDLPTEDISILELIINTAENDKNTNVRLAAVQALSNYLSAPIVPIAFKRMLINEEDPAVKIAIIETVSQIKSEEIIQSLENLAENQDLPQYVKDEAHNSMTILQHGEEF